MVKRKSVSLIFFTPHM